MIVRDSDEWLSGTIGKLIQVEDGKRKENAARAASFLVELSVCWRDSVAAACRRKSLYLGGK